MRSTAGFVLLLLLSACGVGGRGGDELRGLASWYGAEFEGRRTASGEAFDAEAMTAAHRTLPFGTSVRVWNLSNGRNAVVRINDRGPHVRDRVIDVSYAAAQELGMIGHGVAPVRIEVIQGTDAP